MSRRLIAVGLLLLAILATQNLARMQNVLLATTSLSISNIAVTPGAHAAIISWDTDADSNSTVEFDTELFVDVNSWPVDFYSNWSGNQGENGVNYEYTNDNAAFLPMIYRPLLRRWQDPGSAQTHFRKINTPTTKKIEFEPGHEGGTQYPFPSLSWTVPELAEYWILGSAECDQNTCGLGDGITVRVYANGSQVNATNVSAGNSPEINTSLGRLPPGTRIRVTIDSRQNSYYDAGNLSNLRIHGYSNAYRNASADASLTTHHEITLPGLAPETAYHYRVKSCDANGCTQSGDNTFTTQPELQIGNISAIPDWNGAVIYWQTNVAANSSVNFRKYTSGLYTYVNFYENWSNTQGQNNIYYKSFDGVSHGLMTYNPNYNGLPTWEAYSGALCHISRDMEYGNLTFHPGTGGGGGYNVFPQPYLEWITDSANDYLIQGNVSCGVVSALPCNGWDGFTIRIFHNEQEVNSTYVGGAPFVTRELMTKIPNANSNDSIRILVDGGPTINHDWGTFENLQIWSGAPKDWNNSNDPTLNGFHIVTIRSIDPNTRYQYEVTSCTWESCVTSSNLSFVTRNAPPLGGSPMMLPLLKSRVMQQE